MKSASLGLWIAVTSATFGAASASGSSPPRALDSRLVFERIAAEPEIVTPTGIAVDHRGRILVVESHTHFRPAGYQGPPADRIRVFEDRDHDGKPECTGTFFEGTQKTMNVAVTHDGSVFVATRSALYRLEDRDDDGRSDGTAGGKLPAPIIRLDTKGDYPHNGLSDFAFDYAGKVYFGLGENLGADYRLVGHDGTTLSGGGEGGNIYRCRPDGTQLERVATGFWNPFHVAFDVFGRLFAVDNDPDSRPPCCLLHIVENEMAGEDYIVALLRDSRTSASVIARGLRMLRASHPALTLDRLRRFVTGNDEGVAIEAVRTLSQSPSPGRFAVLSKLATDRNVSLPLRAEATLGLADDATSQHKTLLALATGDQAELRREALRGLRGIPLTEQENSALRASSRDDVAALELLDSLDSAGGSAALTPGPGRPSAVDFDAWLGLLEGPANPLAGERIFFHPKGPGCFRCHQINGRGARAGPDLSTLAAGMDRRRLVESILTPSKEIAPQFVAWSVARTDGTVFTGILLEQSPEGALVFADAQGRLTAVKASEIAERKAPATSIMPDNLVQTMTLQDFRDLLAFLLRRK